MHHKKGLEVLLIEFTIKVLVCICTEKVLLGLKQSVFSKDSIEMTLYRYSKGLPYLPNKRII